MAPSARRRRRAARAACSARRDVSAGATQPLSGRASRSCRPRVDEQQQRQRRPSARAPARPRSAGRAARPSGGRSRPRAWRTRGPPSSRITPNDVNVKRNTIDAADAIAGAQQRQGDLAERAPRDAPQHARRVLEPRVELRPQPADRCAARRRSCRRRRRARMAQIVLSSRTPAGRAARAARGTRSRRRPSAARTARSRKRGQHARPGNSKRAKTYAAGQRRAGRSARSRATACQSVNHATSRTNGWASVVESGREVELAARRQAQRDDRRDRADEEHRAGTRAAAPPAAAQAARRAPVSGARCRSTPRYLRRGSARSARIHLIGCVAWAPRTWRTRRSAAPGDRPGSTYMFSGMSSWNSARQHEVDRTPRAVGRSARAGKHARELDLPEAAVGR